MACDVWRPFPDDWDLDRKRLKKVLREYPNLNLSGVHAWPQEEGRDAMLTDWGLRGFQLASAFLDVCTPTKRAWRNGVHSYRVKHHVENLVRQTGCREDPYVADGLLIAAALALGIGVKPAGNGSVFLCVSPKSIRDAGQTFTGRIKEAVFSIGCQQ